jgi:PAS domain S-box-containing protein
VVERVVLSAASSTRAADLLGVDLASRPFYQASRRSLAPVWSDTFLSSLSGRVAAALAVPSGARTVVAELSLQTMTKAVQDLSETQGNLIVVIDGRGRVIAHPDATLAARQENLSSIPLVRRGMAGGQEHGDFAWAGVSYLGSIAPVGPTGWSVLVGQSKDVVYRPLLRLGWALLGGLLLSVLGSLLGAWWLSRQADRRYRQLLQAAESFVQATPLPQVDFDVEEFAQLWLNLRLLFEQIGQRDAETRATRVQLQAVLDAATEVAIISTDAQGVITVFNRGASKMLGYPPDQVMGREAAVFHDELEVRERARELSAQLGRHIDGFETFVAVARQTGYEVRDWTYVRSDGGRLQVSLAVTAVRDGAGLVTGFLGVAVDQTSRIRAAALDVARQAAEAASLAKTEFLSRVSHELRTPLNAMLGYAQLIEIDADSPLTVKQQGRLKSVQQAGWHLVQLIEDVLDLSRIESGNLGVLDGPVDVQRVVDDALELVAPLLSGRGLTLQLDPAHAGRAPTVLVWGDKTRLMQVMVNLLTNAIKYNKDQGRVSVLIHTSMPDHIRIEVSDTGRGMCESQLARIFEPFNRLGMESSGIEGTGIGLLITKRLIELMGGTLAVTSAPGQGSSFVVSLRPVKGGQPRPSVDQIEAPAVALLSPAPGHDHRLVEILYIEDNAVNAMLMETVVSMRPWCRLHVAATASEGAAVAARLRPELVLLDLHLPDGSGVALLHRLRQVDALRHTRIVAVSADATQTQIDNVLAAGAYAYLTKPISLPEVFRVLDELG